MKLMNLKNFRRAIRQTGQGMTEYIIIVAVIAIGSIGVYTFYGDILRSQTAVAGIALAGESGVHQMDISEQRAIVIGIEAGVGRDMENFSEISTVSPHGGL